MIAIPIVSRTVNRALMDIRRASRIVDTIELRLDFIKNINEENLKKLLSKSQKLKIFQSSKKKIIVTDRKNRIGLINEAINLKADFVDLDIGMGKEKIKKIMDNSKKTKIIISYHNYKKTSKREIIKKYNQIKKLNPHIIKIVTFANSINDNIIIFDLIKRAKKENKKIITICMGEKGQISRILSPLFGAVLTFASLSRGKESAPGQITVDRLINLYRIDKLKTPKIYGLVGSPVKHSKGIIIHNKSFRKSDPNNIYLNFLVDDLKKFIKNYKKLITGLSITIPFKRDIIKHLDKVDPIAKRIGAVNTVISKGGELIGYNTDLTGAIKSIETKTKIKGKNVLMIGAGGVARAIAYGITEKKGNLTILNRTKSKAKKLAKELKCKSGGLNDLNKLNNMDIIINGTSIGMYPNIYSTPIKKQILKKIINKKSLVFDSVYNPKKTKLLKEAKKLGCNVLGGYDMFINQAKEQFKLFTGRRLI